MHEIDLQINEMMDGLGEVVPLNALRVLTWQEAEVLACGRQVGLLFCCRCFVVLFCFLLVLFCGKYL